MQNIIRSCIVLFLYFFTYFNFYIHNLQQMHLEDAYKNI